MVTEIVILSFLSQRPRHGYEIKKDVEMILHRQTALNNNHLYPTLHRFEESGVIERVAERTEEIPTRVTYRITEKGRRLFEELITSFSDADAGKEDEFLVRLAFFGGLEPATRARILETRKRALERSLAHRQFLAETYPSETLSPWVQSLITFQRGQISGEIAWIEDLQRLATAMPVEKSVTARASKKQAEE